MHRELTSLTLPKSSLFHAQVCYRQTLCPGSGNARYAAGGLLRYRQRQPWEHSPVSPCPLQSPSFNRFLRGGGQLARPWADSLAHGY